MSKTASASARRIRAALIIPAFNEAQSIGAVVARSSAFGLPIVVDDGSTDGTAEVACRAGAEVVRHAVNRGYEEALESGFLRAWELGAEYGITLDADGQHDPGTIDGILRALDEGADVVVGIRDRKQRVAEHVFAWIGQLLWSIEDPLCGMKGYRMSVYRARGCFDSCSSVGSELAIFAAARRMKIAQVAVATRPRGGRPRFGRGVAANMRIMWALLAVTVKWGIRRVDRD